MSSTCDLPVTSSRPLDPYQAWLGIPSGRRPCTHYQLLGVSLGQRDPDVPWEMALRIAERIPFEDVQILLVKDGDHRLSRPQDLTLLRRTLAPFLGEDGG